MAREWAVAAVLLLALLPMALHAQAASSRTGATWAETGAGSELERYLRTLQLGGAVPVRDWTVRAFSPAELEALTPPGSHPWSKRFAAVPKAGWWIVRPAAGLIGNSGFPWGMNDGPTWAGKGITAVATGGVAARWRAVSMQLAPHAWWTQNADFTPLPPMSKTGPGYLDYAFVNIDLPQRFGDKALGQVDLGESWVRVDGFGVAAGFSSASEWWGPGVSSGFMLSNNAGGIPRLFLGTSSPRNIGIGQVHGRVFAGRLVPSSFSNDLTNPTRKRLGLGLVGSFEPRGVPGLVLGLTRFFHRRWRDGGPNYSDIRQLWEPFLKEGIRGKDDLATIAGQADNQLASVFGRVVLPRGGVEVYSEYGREDHSWDALNLATEPDHISTVTFGFQKQLGSANAAQYWVAHGEVTNARVTHLARVRGEGLFYEHGQLLDGHTLRGQLLGSPFVRGGSGAELGADRYHTSGRFSVRWLRIGLARQTEGGLGYGATHEIEASGVRFLLHGDVTWRAGIMRRVGDTAARDATNLNAVIGWRWTP
jgi:hypothetical protein